MKMKIAIGLLCVFLGTLILSDINVAFGVFLAALGVCSLIDVFTQKANSRYQLTAIKGTFKATAEGTDIKEVERELDRTIKSWQTNHP